MKLIQPALTLWLAVIVLILAPFFLRIIVIEVDWKTLKQLVNIVGDVIKGFLKVIQIRIQLLIGSVKMYIKIKKVEKFVKKIKNKLRKAGLMMTETGDIIKIEQYKSLEKNKQQSINDINNKVNQIEKF